MRIVIGSDHAGYVLKEYLKTIPGSWVDTGCSNADTPVSYSNIARTLGHSIHIKKYKKGVLICGSGIGMSMAANRFPGVRAALCMTAEMARLSRLHNDSNILCLGARLISMDIAREILETWLSTDFEGGRHLKRIQTMDEVYHVEGC